MSLHRLFRRILLWLPATIVLCSGLLFLAAPLPPTQAQVAPPDTSPATSVSFTAGRGAPTTPDGAIILPVVDVFTNTWHRDGTGVTYNSNSGDMLYAHIGHSADPATLWEVASYPPYSPIASYDLSALNPGLDFPEALNDRTGAAFDAAANSYFLSHPAGQLPSYSTNIVEINRSGIIKNAWQTYGANNDSSDGSAIDFIQDIAVVGGISNRYFVTNADNTLYEIALNRNGVWTDDSWHTVATCTLPNGIMGMGIEYDERTGWLLVSNYQNDTLTYIDFDCIEQQQLACEVGAINYHGITIKSAPYEVWAMDYNNDRTVRCLLDAQISLTVGTDPTTCATTDSITVTAGTTVTYCYDIVNNSAITLNSHDIADSIGLNLLDVPYVVPPGGEATLLVNYPATQSSTNYVTWFAASTDYYRFLSQDPTINPFCATDLPDVSALTPLHLTDDGGTGVTLPFDFRLYDTISDQLYVSNNGGVLVGTLAGTIPPGNTTLPTDTLSNAILPYWDDIDDEQGDVYAGSFIIDRPFTTLPGQAWAQAGDSISYAIIWHERPLYPGNAAHDTGTFALYFGGATPGIYDSVAFCYHDTDFEGTTGDFGARATVGLNRDGGFADLGSFNTASPLLHNDTNITYYPYILYGQDNARVNVLAASPTPTASPTAANVRLYCQPQDVAIPDSNPTGAASTITVPDAFLVQDLNVVLSGTHSYVGDLRFTLNHGATGTTLFDRPGVPATTYGCTGDNLPNLYADDEGGQGSLENSCTPDTPAYTPNGAYSPNSPLSVYDSGSTAGTWTLTAADLAGATRVRCNSGVCNSRSTEPRPLPRPPSHRAAPP